MYRTLCISLLAALMLNFIPMAYPVAGNTTGTVNWLTFDEAQERGREQPQKFLLYFYTDWCGYCRKLDKGTFSDKAVADYINANFIPVRINSERLPKVAARFGVGGVPDLRFLDAKGENIARWPGYIEADRFLPLLQFIHTDSYKKMSYGDFLKKK